MSEMDETNWRSVYRDLKAKIDDGRLPPGAALPTQAGLAFDYNVGRHVIRRALCVLSRDGYVTSWQGRGACVSDPRIPFQIGTRTRFNENLRRIGRCSETRFLGTRSRLSTEAVAELLGLTRRDKVVITEVLRLVDGRPLALTRHYFDLKRFPRIQDDIEQAGSITKAFETNGITDYLRLETRVETRRPQPSEMIILDIPMSQPVLVMTGQDIDSRGRPVDISETVVRGDRIRLLI